MNMDDSNLNSNTHHYSRLLLEIAGFAFYLYEVYSEWFYGEDVFITDDYFLLHYLKIFTLFIVLPLLYLFRIAYYFDWEESLSDFLSNVFKFENVHVHLQVKLVYYAIQIAVLGLVFFEIFERMYS